jgi:CRISPR-associated protein Cas2
MNMIVAYDIADPKRLSKIAKIMLDYGTRVQKSIFEATLNGPRFREMKDRIESIIVFEEDGVKYFPLCEKCAGTVEIIGQGQFTDPDKEFYVY